MRSKKLNIHGIKQDCYIVASLYHEKLKKRFKVYGISDNEYAITGNGVKVLATTSCSGIIGKYLTLQYQPKENQTAIKQAAYDFLGSLIK